MPIFELRSNDKCVRSDMVQELRQLALHTEGDWSITEVRESKMNPVWRTRSGRVIAQADIDNMKSEFKRGYPIQTIRKKYGMSYEKCRQLIS